MYKWIGLTVLCVCISGCFTPKAIKTSQEIAQRLNQNDLLSDYYFDTEVSRIHYVQRGDIHKPTLVFIHGTPGSWEVFSKQLEDEVLLQAFNLVSIDRPGWGSSSFKQNEYPLSLSLQAKMIEPLLSKLRETSSHIILVGHSLGATLVPVIAIESPGLVDGVIAIAGDLSANLLKKQWYNSVAQWRLSQKVLPESLLLANDEVLALPKNLEQLNLSWIQLEAPMLVIQGLDDALTNPGNAGYAKKIRSKGGVEVEAFVGSGHLLHIELSDKVNSLIMSFSQQVINKS